PVLIPADRHIAIKGGVRHLCIWFDPVDAFTALAPEVVAMSERFLVEPEVFGLIDLADIRMGRDRDHIAVGHVRLPPLRASLLNQICRSQYDPANFCA